MAWTPNGKIVVGGRRWTSDVVSKSFLISARLDAKTGAVDTSYAGNGFASYRVGKKFMGYGFAAVLANGKVVLAGSTHKSWVVVRFTPSGVLDATFGTNGAIQVVSSVETPAYLIDMAIDRLNKRVVLVGRQTDDEFDRWLAMGSFTLS